jgi:hypothetical protein
MPPANYAADHAWTVLRHINKRENKKQQRDFPSNMTMILDHGRIRGEIYHIGKTYYALYNSKEKEI